MAGEDVEVGAQRLDVDRQVDDALGAVDDDLGAHGMGLGGDGAHIVEGAQHIRHLGDGDDLGLRRQHVFEGRHIERTVVEDGDIAQDAALALAQHVPGHDIGVVLHLGGQDLIAGLQPLAPGPGDQVDGLGRRLGEDDLIDGGADKAGHGLAAGLVGVGGLIGQAMQAAMHIGVGMAHGVRHGLDHRFGLLRRGAGVEIDQGLAVDFAAEDRELGAGADNVKGHEKPPCVRTKRR